METPMAQALKAEVQARVRPFCLDWPAEQFDRVVEHIVAVTLKYDQVITPRVDTASTGRMIADLNTLADRSAGARDEPRAH